MPDVIAVFSRWWKWIAAVTVIATVVATVLVLLLPPKYVSVATALPASSLAADKAAIFNTGIQQLYSSLGTADDLDRIIGTARLDTIYIAAVAELNLAAHYGFKEMDAKSRAVQKLKQHSAISKSEWGELKIKVWDSNRNAAAQLANALLKNLQRLHQNLQNQSNQLVLQKLEEAHWLLQQQDTTPNTVQSKAVAGVKENQLQEYEKLLSEYRLMAATNPPVLLVVEAARPAHRADYTEKTAYVAVAFFTAFLFSFIVALFAEGKKRHA